MQKTKIPQYPPVFILKIIERFRFFLTSLSKKLTPPNVAMIELVQGFYVSKAIAVAAELNIAEFLKDVDKPVSELSSLTQTNEESLYRLLRMLASQGIFKEKKEKVFSNNNLSKTLLDKQNSMRHMVIHQVNSINWKMFEELDYVVKTGKCAAKKVVGMDIFEYLQQNPDRNRIYNQAMTNSSLMLSYAILSEYSFKDAECIVDLGGGEGILLSIILNKHKNIKGKVFDLPHVIEGTKDIFKQYGVEDRTEALAGNFFKSIPKGGDVYLLKSIIHNLSDNQCITLLKDIRNVLPGYGKVLVIEPIIEPGNRYSFAKLYDIQMLVSRNGGKERTFEEYKRIVEESGLKLNRVIKTAAPFSVIEIIV